MKPATTHPRVSTVLAVIGGQQGFVKSLSLMMTTSRNVSLGRSYFSFVLQGFEHVLGQKYLNRYIFDAIIETEEKKEKNKKFSQQYAHGVREALSPET